MSAVASLPFAAAPPAVWIVAAAVLGLLLGSFLNVCIARLPRHESIVWPGSRCPRCGVAIRALDNIPVLSYGMLRGRCRACRAPIALRYPLVELGYAALAVASVLRWGATPQALAGAVFCFLVLGLLVTDLETMLLPDALTLPGIVLGVVAAATLAPGARLAAAELAVEAGLAPALALLLLRWAYWLVRRREGLGLGDVKLMAMMGAWLGPGRVAVAFLLGVVAAALWGLVLLARGVGGQDRGSVRLPLGAFLCGGGLVALFAGDRLLGWYLGLFR